MLKELQAQEFTAAHAVENFLHLNLKLKIIFTAAHAVENAIAERVKRIKPFTAAHAVENNLH